MILVIVMFLGSAGFGIWAFSSRQDYKNYSDRKTAAAVTVAEQQMSTKKDNEFAQAEKLPLRTYTGPAPYGSLKVQYPKTWSAYVSEGEGSSGTPVDAYFNPGYVPSISGQNNLYALRVKISSASYDSTVKSFQPLLKVGKLTATSYIPAGAKDITGVKLDGQITAGKTGSMVILPLRDKTLQLWTESPSFINDFNNNILPNYTFVQ